METDVGVAASCGQESSLNLAPSEVRSMHDAAVGVATLTGQVQGAVCTHRKKSRRAKKQQVSSWKAALQTIVASRTVQAKMQAAAANGLPPPAARKFAACNPAALTLVACEVSPHLHELQHTCRALTTHRINSPGGKEKQNG